jgi:alpha-beta hydrolase superfamily lysophospholipase
MKINGMIGISAKFLRITLSVLLLSGLAVAGILIILAWGYAFVLSHSGCQGRHDSLASRGFAAEPVEFTTTAGYTLKGWYSRGSRFPEAAIVVLPGMSGDTQMALADSEILARAGYSTLIYEHRSCANFALLHSGGYLEAGDLDSAVDYLESRGDVRHIGVMGFSTGGTAALLSAAKDPRIEAVIAKGVPTRFLTDTQPGLGPANQFGALYHRLVLKFFALQTSLSPYVTEPVDAIGGISPRPVLLIHGEYEAAAGQELYARAGEPKELWIVPGARHGGYQAANPEEYARRVVHFFDNVFNTQK